MYEPFCSKCGQNQYRCVCDCDNEYERKKVLTVTAIVVALFLIATFFVGCL